MLKNIAVLTHGRLVSDDLGIKLENITFKDLGSAKSVKITKDSTTIVDGRGDEEIENSTSVLKIEKLYIINKNFLDLNNLNRALQINNNYF